MQLYADIVLPLAQPVYTFAVPGGTDVAAGQAVAVQFGARKFYTGIVWRVHDRRPDFKTVKPIQRVLYDAPLLSAQQMSLWEWIASYYMCSLGEVMRVALPALMKPSGDTEEEFSGDEFRPRTECYVSLAAELRDEGRFHEVCEKIERRAPKQYEALLELAAAGDETRIATGEVARRLLRADYAVLHALERKKYIVCTQRERSVERGESAFRLPELTAHQLTALNALREQFAAGKTTALLQGVTGSGKTEIYIHLIAEVLSRGGDVLLLVPEIALTAQLIERMERIFGSRVTPYHSKLTNRRRTETYLRLNRSDGGEFVVGVRSSVFLPLKHLQLIVVDEEHDASYKQTEPAPRYNARDCAVVMARLTGGRTLLGSATPSLLSYFRAESGRYRLLELPERVMHRPLPEVEVVDMREEFLSGNNGIFSGRLVSLLGACFDAGRQAMLFMNRRGYSTFVSCRACGNVVQCPNCDISMTYHKAEQRLRCHFCGASAPLPQRCPACGKPFIKYFGVGTEQVEEQLHALFPQVRALRMDTDTMRGKDAHAHLLEAFASGEAQVLIGTQMIAKGHDFPNVTLVGVVAADATLCIPDYRSAERAFQLLTQVSGRAGRDEAPGRVVVQTYQPGHPVIRFARAHDYRGFYRYELLERRKALLPPYSLFLRILFSGPDEAALAAAGERYGAQLEAEIRLLLGEEGAQDLLLLLPSPAPIRKKQGVYRYQVLVKLLRTRRTAAVIRLIYAFAAAHRNELFAQLEVNPQDMF